LFNPNSIKNKKQNLTGFYAAAVVVVVVGFVVAAFEVDAEY